MPTPNGWTPVDESAAGWTPVAEDAPVQSAKVGGRGIQANWLPQGFSPSTALDNIKANLPTLGEEGKGLVKGALSTAANLGKYMILGTPEQGAAAVAPLAKAAVPANTAQALGKGAEQAAEFLVPSGLEEHVGALIASKFPLLSKTAATLLAHPEPEMNAAGKIMLQALSSGVVNKAQGGSFTQGAVGGAAAGAAGEAAKVVAPIVAETAMGVRATDRAYGRTPGQFIIDNTSGVRPGSVAAQAVANVAQNTADLEKAAVNSPIAVNLQPARDKAADLLRTAAKQNNPSTIREVGQIGSQLDARGTVPIPQYVSADEGLALRRGVDDLQGSWNPNLKRTLSDQAITKTRNALNDELEQAIPGFRDYNAALSTGIPVADRAGAVDLNAGILQRVIGRLAKPTGALIGAGVGGGAGYKENGLEGALIGGGVGLFAPEVLSSPTTLMAGARALNSPALQAGLTMAQGAAQQSIKPSGEAAWANLGAGKLHDHIERLGDKSPITDDQVDALQGTPEGRYLLVQASDLAPGSAAMNNLVKSIQPPADSITQASQ